MTFFPAVQRCNHRERVHLRQNEDCALVIWRVSWEICQYHSENGEGGYNDLHQFEIFSPQEALGRPVTDPVSIVKRINLLTIVCVS